MYTDEEITSLGFTPYAIGNAVDAVILQADHKEYKSLTKADFPRVQAVVDGRRTMDRKNFEGVAFRVIGAGA